MQATTQWIEQQIREYAEGFLRTQYGDQAAKRFTAFGLTAVDAYDTGGISEVTEDSLRIAAKRDMIAGKLTTTTKLILRHELGHIIDDSEPFPEFEEKIENEKSAWINAKPKNAAEHWYKNISIRTHLDPLKMAAMGFPRPETKISPELLEQGTKAEVERMKKVSPWVDENLAKRFAMANLVEDQSHYSRKNF